MLYNYGNTNYKSHNHLICITEEAFLLEEGSKDHSVPYLLDNIFKQT